MLFVPGLDPEVTNVPDTEVTLTPCVAYSSLHLVEGGAYALDAEGSHVIARRMRGITTKDNDGIPRVARSDCGGGPLLGNA